MTKQEFLASMAKMYRVANLADSDIREDWTSPDMARTVCSRFDRMLDDMIESGVLTADERQAFIDDL